MCDGGRNHLNVRSAARTKGVHTHALRDQLVADGLDVTFVPFHGPHAIARPALETFAELIREHL